ncbi:MAG: radical SAM protein [Planctomycetes bacterium]|nr:radical SAM protein [Planctomycetota bacterium]
MRPRTSAASATRRAFGFYADLAAAQFRRRTPYKLTYIVTDECSCRCAICALWKAPRPGARTDEIERLFAANPELSWINLSGGDVVERDDFLAIVTAAVSRTRVFVLDFPTAGQEPERVEDAVRATLELPLPKLVVTVSIDGPPELHDRLRGRAGAFDRARETFERLSALRSRRFQAYVGLTFSSRNDARPAQLVDDVLAHLPGVAREQLHFNLAHHAPHYYRNRPDDVPDRERLVAFLHDEERRRRTQPRSTPLRLRWLEATYWKLAVEYLERGRSPLPCSALASSVFVDADLRVFPCATWDRPLANLRDVGYSLRAALARPDAIAAAEDAHALRCPNCWTPCEAFPTILSHAPRALVRARHGAAPNELKPVVPDVPHG